jgi:hypothetical protein
MQCLFLELHVCWYKNPKCTCTISPVGGCFKFSLILKNLFENVKSTISWNLNYKSESLLLVNSFKFRYE